MPQTLFIIKGTHQGNRMGDPDKITYSEEFAETKTNHAMLLRSENQTKGHESMISVYMKVG